MTYPTFLRNLSFIFIIFLSYKSYAQCNSDLLLSSWTQRGPQRNGNWLVSADGKSVLQSENRQPTFFVSPDSIINTTVRGSFNVNSISDDDYIGFVFGFKGSDSTDDNYDFYLFDWKQKEQSSGGVGYEGFTLSQVRGNSVNLWIHKGDDIQVLSTLHGKGLGWLDKTPYEFTLSFTDTTIVILINSDTIFDVKNDTTTFQNGFFGFYNFSQSSVQYQNFTYNACTVNADSAIVIENGAVTIPTLKNDISTDGELSALISSIYDPPLNGSTIISEKNVIYVPNTDYSGSDSFKYIISNKLGDTDTVSVYVTVVDVKAPHALNFINDRIDASVPHPANGSLDVDSQENFTLELWFKTMAVDGREMMIQKGNDTMIAIGMNAGRVFSILSDGLLMDSAITTNRYDDDEWHYISVVVDRVMGMQIYIDGANDGVDNTISVGSLTNTDDLIIGSENRINHFKGLLDEVRLWREALSLEDVNRLIHKRITMTDPLWERLMAYYQMDEGGGITLYDYSANNNEGTLNSASWRSLAPANLMLSGKVNVTENFTYLYSAVPENCCSRLFQYKWNVTNGAFLSKSDDSMKVELFWDLDETWGALGLQATHSNWGDTELSPILDVTINSNIIFTDSIVIHDGDSILIDNLWQKTSAVFSDTIHFATGPDSIFNQRLVVIPLENKMFDIPVDNEAIYKINEGQLRLELFPNPTPDRFKIQFNRSIGATFEIFDFSGKLIQSSDFETTAQIDLSRYSKGIYLVKVATEDRIYTKEVMKE